MGNRFAPRAPINALSTRALASSEAHETALPRLYSTQEVCAIFNRHPRTIRAWRQAGYLLPVRVGKAVFFTEHAILAALHGPDNS